jgi:branched-chain amino acid transport system permease protein
VSEFLSFTVLGITLGAVYAVAASGLVVTYMTTGVFNIAQGAVGMIAAYAFYELWQAWHWPLLVAIAVVLFVLAPLMALVVEYVFMRQLNDASTERSLMVTLGLLLILVGIATAFWGSPTPRVVPFLLNGQVHIFSVNILYDQVLTVVVAVVLAGGLWLAFRALRIGVAMRAVVDDPELLAMSGARPVRVSQAGWALGFTCGALAGILIAPTLGATGLTITVLTLLVVDAYAAAVIGRLRSLPWTFVGALILGLGIEYCQAYLPTHLPTSLQSLDDLLPEILPAVFLFVALLFVPAVRLKAAGRLSTAMPPRVAGLRASIVGGGVVVVAVVVLTAFLVGSALGTLTQGLALGIVALSLVLLTGYAGQVSLCQVTFLGIGAFTMGKVAGGGSWWGMLAAIGVTAALGALIAFPTLRLRGLYLALATLAFAEAADYGLFQNSSFIPEGGQVAVGRLGFFGMTSVGDRFFAVEVAVAFALCAIAVLAIRRSVTGRRLVALHDSPAAFATLGLDAQGLKVAVFALSAGMAGFGGCLWAGEQGGIGSNDADFLLSMVLLLLVAVWGIRTATGALLGGLSAAILPAAQLHLPQSLSDLTGLVAGAGIVVLGRNADGVLGLALPWLRRHVPSPWMGPAARGGGDPAPLGAGPDLAEGAIGVAG